MHPLFILAIIAGAVFIATVIIAAVIDDPRPLFVGLPAVLLGLILLAIGATAEGDEYNEETNQICLEKGGVVSKDNHCFVNGEPVEFSPGVWQR